MNNSTIRVESHNPEFKVSESLNKGEQVDGFILLGIRNDEPYMEIMNGMSIDDLSEFWRTDTRMCCVLRQAAAIGEGRRAADSIHEEWERNKTEGMDGTSLAKMLMEMGASGSAEAETE